MAQFTRQIKLQNRTVNYTLERKAVKNLNVRIKSDGSVYVSANNGVSLAEIETFLLSKAEFICKALDRCERLSKNVVPPTRYADGDKIRIFGKDKTLVVRCGDNGVVETDDYITLSVKDVADLNLKKRVLDAWLHTRFQKMATAICKVVFPVFSRYGVGFPQLKFRQMRSRWGSCNPTRGVITLNYALVAAPPECVEYVVTHEFCHFLQPDHSSAFHACMTAVMPDWKFRKKLLNAVCTTQR